MNCYGRALPLPFTFLKLIGFYTFETVLVLHIPLLEIPFTKEINIESLSVTFHLRSSCKE